METTTRLQWDYTPVTWDDTGETDQHWYSGIFKITYYPEVSDLKYQPAYCAYFKPRGWKNWGNRVNRAVQYYSTLEAAQEACQSFDPAQANHY